MPAMVVAAARIAEARTDNSPRTAVRRRIGATVTRSTRLDNLTHALVGAAIAKAGAERATPLATATLVVAANAPDVDMLSFVRGEYFALAFRRGLTHGWPALLVLPVLVTGSILAWDRWVRLKRDPDADPARPRAVLALAAVGLLTHPSLDWLNIYGMRWGLPFDGAWTYGDALFIIDPWIWLVLGGAVYFGAAPGRRGRVGWAVLAALTTLLMAIGVGGWPAMLFTAGVGSIVAARARFGPGGPGRRRGPAVAAIAVVAGYVAVMVVADAAASRQVFAMAEAEGLDPSDVLVAPTRGVPFVAELEVRSPEGYVPGAFDWFATPRVRLRPDETIPFLDGGAIPEPTLSRVVERARQRSDIRNYLVWSRYPYVRVRPDQDGWRVRFGDARYDSQPEAAGLAGVTVHVSSSEIR